MYLGIELEVEAGQYKAHDKPVLVMAWLEKHGHSDKVYIKEDSSLSNGFEIVFHPITLQALHKLFPMKLFLAYLQSIKLTSHKNGTCGLHVHLSRKKLKDSDIYKGKMFFYKCSEYLKKFSARNKFNYCKFDEAMPSSWNDQEFGKYSAFNSCASPSTVELRLFRGTLIYDRFLASIQFSDLFGEYIQKVSMSHLRTDKNVFIWQSFIDFAKRSNRYSQFIKYVIKKGII